MLRPNRSTEPDDGGADAGSAAIEFIFAGLVLLVPIVYLIVALGAIQGQAMGVQTAARQLARSIATADGAADADRRAERIADAVAEEYGIDRASLEVSVECTPTAQGCPSAGATLHVHVATRVALPLIPPVLGLDDLAAVPVEAQAVHKVSRYAVAP
ncbi:TadE family protein [Microbacterium telephonicum]|uniref:TadE-like protein n=1 Tax=Microbacterium telephonicum TaxID=1714841 RepID=A0A498C9M4_9MICO|nr:TadE family protein [Microbacterium telephonicum]RLK49148.1 hypothetical protein C7474_1283 [Microbacterium telephonicum]